MASSVFDSVPTPNKTGEKAWGFLVFVMEDKEEKMENRIAAAIYLSQCDDAEKAAALLHRDLEGITEALEGHSKVIDKLSWGDADTMGTLERGVLALEGIAKGLDLNFTNGEVRS